MIGSRRLNRFRQDRGMTLADLSREAGVTISMAQMLCAGTRPPGLKLAVKIERMTASWPLGPIRPWEWCEANGEAA